MPLASYASLVRQIWNAPGNAHHRLGALTRACCWFAHQRGLGRLSEPAPLPVFGGQRTFPCYRDSIIAKHVMYRSEWFDWNMLHFLKQFLRPSDHFLDIGANLGLHTLLASTCIDTGAGGSLTCIEPDPRNLLRLRHTLEINHLQEAVTIHPVAASDAAGEVSLEGSDVFTRIQPSTSGLDAKPQPGSLNSKSETTVPSVPLDALIPSSETIHACKIDVEGAEWQVLKGAQQLISSGNLPCLIFEHRGHGPDEQALLHWLEARGYHLGRYCHHTRSLHLHPPYHDDVYAFTKVGLGLVHDRMLRTRIVTLATS